MFDTQLWNNGENLHNINYCVRAIFFSIMNEEWLKWQEVGTRSEDIVWIAQTAKAFEQDPIRLGLIEELFA